MSHLARTPNLKFKIIETEEPAYIGYFMKDVPFGYQLRYLQKEDDKTGWVSVEILILSPTPDDLSVKTSLLDENGTIHISKTIVEVAGCEGEIIAMVNSFYPEIPNLTPSVLDEFIIHERLICQYIDHIALIDGQVSYIHPWSINSIKHGNTDKSWAW